MIPAANHYLVISALGNNLPGLMNEFLRIGVQCGCNILFSKFNVLGQELSMTLLAAGNWGGIAKLEAALPIVEKKWDLVIHTRRTHEPTSTLPTMTYLAQITAIDRIGILNNLSDFFSKQNIPVEEITVNTYLTHTGTRMVFIQIKLNVPEKVHLATFREHFMMLCDDHNLEGFVEPFRLSA